MYMAPIYLPSIMLFTVQKEEDKRFEIKGFMKELHLAIFSEYLFYAHINIMKVLDFYRVFSNPNNF